MNESHPIDDLFRGRLKEYEMSPPMQLWDAIEQKRPRPRPAFWWLRKNGLLLGIGLLVIAIVGVLLFRGLRTDAPTLQHFPVYLEHENTTADLSTPDLDESQKLAILPSQSEPGGANTAAPSLPSGTDENNLRLTNSNDYSTNVQGDAPQVASTPPPSTDPSSSAAPQKPLLNKEQEIMESADLPLEEKTNYSRTSIKAFSSLASAALMPLEANNYVEEQATWPVWTGGSGNGITYYMEAFGSPGFANRSITPVNETFSFLSQEWESAQQQQSALQFGFRLAGVNRKGWSLRTGFHFTQIQESFEFVHHTAEIEQVYDPDGGFVREDTVFVPSGAAINSQNEYALLDVPLILGYQKRFQRWTVSAQAGPIFNLSFQPKGTLINPNRQLISTESPEAQSAFRSTLGINWYTGLGLQYEIQPGVHLMLEPHLRFQQRSFMEAGFPVQQKFLTGGVSVGVRKQIIR